MGEGERQISRVAFTPLPEGKRRVRQGELAADGDESFLRAASYFIAPLFPGQYAVEFFQFIENELRNSVA